MFGSPPPSTTSSTERHAAFVHPRRLTPIGWGTHALVALSSLFFLFWLIPLFDGLPGASRSLDAPNEKSRVMGMASIGLFGELQINRVRRELWWTRDTDLAGRRRTKADGPHAPQMLYYPSKTPGFSMMVGGLYWLYRRYISKDPPTLYRATYFARLFGTLLPTWLTSLLFYFVLLRICRERYIILTGYYVFLLGNMTLPYALTVSSHSLSNGMLLTSFVLLWWCPRSFWKRALSASLAGLCIGIAFGAEYSAVFTGVFLGLFALLHAPPTFRRYSHQPMPRGWRAPWVWLAARWHLLFALGASLIPVAAVLWYHKQAFGSYWKTPYHFMLNPTFRSAMQQSRFMGFHWPPNWNSVGELLFSPAAGLYFWTPTLLFSLVGAYYLSRQRAYKLLIPFTLLMCWWMFYPSMIANPRGGWSVGPRYIANIVPFAMLLGVWGMERLYVRLGDRIVPLIAASAIWSILHYTPASVLFPHLPTSTSLPQVDIISTMIRRGLAPSTLLPLPPAWAMGIYASAWLAVLLYILIAGFRHKRWAGVTLTTLLLTLLLLIMFQLPPTDYALRDQRLEFLQSLIPPRYRW